MVREAVTYECEICGGVYTRRDDAVCCESKGLPLVVPVGTICQRSEPYLSKVVFAIARNRLSGHGNRPLVWVARDDGGSDTLGRIMAVMPPIKSKLLAATGDNAAGRQSSSPNLHSPNNLNYTANRELDDLIAPDTSLLAFARMVELLRSHDTQVFLWDGNRAIPLQD